MKYTLFILFLSFSTLCHAQRNFPTELQDFIENTNFTEVGFPSYPDSLRHLGEYAAGGYIKIVPTRKISKTDTLYYHRIPDGEYSALYDLCYERRNITVYAAQSVREWEPLDKKSCCPYSFLGFRQKSALSKDHRIERHDFHTIKDTDFDFKDSLPPPQLVVEIIHYDSTAHGYLEWLPLSEWTASGKDKEYTKHGSTVFNDLAGNRYVYVPAGYYGEAHKWHCQCPDKMVWKIQNALRERGYDCPLTGKACNRTKAALIKFKKNNGLVMPFDTGHDLFRALGIEVE